MVERSGRERFHAQQERGRFAHVARGERLQLALRRPQAQLVARGQPAWIDPRADGHGVLAHGRDGRFREDGRRGGGGEGAVLPVGRLRRAERTVGRGDPVVVGRPGFEPREHRLLGNGRFALPDGAGRQRSLCAVGGARPVLEEVGGGGVGAFAAGIDAARDARGGGGHARGCFRHHRWRQRGREERPVFAVCDAAVVFHDEPEVVVGVRREPAGDGVHGFGPCAAEFRRPARDFRGAGVFARVKQGFVDELEALADRFLKAREHVRHERGRGGGGFRGRLLLPHAAFRALPS